MAEIILEAKERANGKFREKGFVPGILYGDGIETATAVKFEEQALNRIITNSGNRAKLWITMNNSKKFGVIKEVQRKPLTRNIIHVDVQIVSKDHEIKMQIPINFKGKDSLNARQLQLQVYKAELSVFGKMALMPDMAEVDVSEMKAGDTVTLNNFSLDKLLKIENDTDVFAAITNIRVQAAETVEDEENSEQ